MASLLNVLQRLPFSGRRHLFTAFSWTILVANLKRGKHLIVPNFNDIKTLAYRIRDDPTELWFISVRNIYWLSTSILVAPFRISNANSNAGYCELKSGSRLRRLAALIVASVVLSRQVYFFVVALNIKGFKWIAKDGLFTTDAALCALVTPSILLALAFTHMLIWRQGEIVCLSNSFWQCNVTISGKMLLSKQF